MNPCLWLTLILSTILSFAATADDDMTAKYQTRKDYEATLAKILRDDAEAVQKCHDGSGPAVEACLIQLRGKRLRAEQEATAQLNRAGQMPLLPNKQAEAASKNALEKAKMEERNTMRDITLETKAAFTECAKVGGPVRKQCEAQVTQRRDEARDLADALFKRSRSEARALKAP